MSEMLHYVHCRAQQRVSLREFEPVWVTVTQQEIVDGVEQYSACPPQLKKWLTTDIATAA
jgi:hypothetical protein